MTPNQSISRYVDCYRAKNELAKWITRVLTWRYQFCRVVVRFRTLSSSNFFPFVPVLSFRLPRCKCKNRHKLCQLPHNYVWSTQPLIIKLWLLLFVFFLTSDKTLLFVLKTFNNLSYQSRSSQNIDPKKQQQKTN